MDLIRNLKMALGTHNLQNTLLLHYKSTNLLQFNPGVFSILHHSGRIPSRVLSMVLLENPLNLVSINTLYSFVLNHLLSWH